MPNHTTAKRPQMPLRDPTRNQKAMVRVRKYQRWTPPAPKEQTDA